MSECTDTFSQSIVARSKRYLLNVPPIRYDSLAKSPYTQRNLSTGLLFTQPDLNMRRKVEILKYSGNKSNTKTNAFTKSEKYAQVINGSYSSRTYSKTFLNNNIIPGTNRVSECPQKKTLSTSSDIPGPTIELYEDLNVPLYMYQTLKVDPYGIINPSTTEIWRTFVNTDIICKPYIPSELMMIQLLTNIPQSSYLYTISMPVAFTISGTSSPEIEILTGIVTTINPDVEVSVYYSGAIVTLAVPPVITFSNPENLSNNMDITTTNGEYYATRYIGMMTISNLLLYTYDNYNYTINIKFDINLENSFNFRTYQPTIGAIANFTGQNTSSNIIITPQTSVPNTGFTFSG